MTRLSMTRLFLMVSAALCIVASAANQDASEYPEGYYAFEEAPGKTPPKVRKPPYLQSKIPCKGALETDEEAKQSLNNLCGDLNEGRLPLNPMGQSVLGHSYPFDLIKNMTLDFFSKTLPILKEDKTLPKVAKLRSRNVPLRDQFRVIRRPVRSSGDEPPADALQQEGETEGAKEPAIVTEAEAGAEGRSLGDVSEGVSARRARAFCDDNWGLFCLLYNTMSGKSASGGVAQDRNDDDFDSSLNGLGGNLGGMQPLTPCPSAVEYITPVFARNYQGVWRYVVQIPYEGYFTQTVEVTQCLSGKCYYLSGACLASPRWVSLLVAEIYYPDVVFPAATGKRPNFSRAAVSSDGPPTPFLQQRQGVAGTTSPVTPHYCDGQDEIGCFQVRLYYDWFLIPGSCKCWKQDYFAQFAYRK